jgi:hypothetical protein
MHSGNRVKCSTASKQSDAAQNRAGSLFLEIEANKNY